MSVVIETGAGLWVDLWPAPDEPFGGGAIDEFVARAVVHCRSLFVGDERDQALVDLVDALMAPAVAMMQAAWLGGTPGAGILDPAICSDWALPIATRAALTRMVDRAEGETEAAYFARARAAALSPPERSVGAVEAVRLAADPHLTGSKSLRIVRRAGDEWHFQVRVRPDEVADADALLAAIDDPFVIPAGQKPLLALVDPGTPWTIGEFENAYDGRPLAEFEGAFASIAEFESHTESP